MARAAEAARRRLRSVRRWGGGRPVRGTAPLNLIFADGSVARTALWSSSPCSSSRWSFRRLRTGIRGQEAVSSPACQSTCRDVRRSPMPAALRASDPLRPDVRRGHLRVAWHRGSRRLRLLRAGVPLHDGQAQRDAQRVGPHSPLRPPTLTAADTSTSRSSSRGSRRASTRPRRASRAAPTSSSTAAIATGSAGAGRSSRRPSTGRARAASPRLRSSAVSTAARASCATSSAAARPRMAGCETSRGSGSRAQVRRRS